MQRWEQESQRLGEGKFVLINGILREGFTDKVTFEQTPEKCEWEGKGLSGGKFIRGKGNSKCKGPVAGLCVASSRHRNEQFLWIYTPWQKGGIGVERHHLHRKQCDWCPLELCSESGLVRTPVWLEWKEGGESNGWGLRGSKEPDLRGLYRPVEGLSFTSVEDW